MLLSKLFKLQAFTVLILLLYPVVSWAQASVADCNPDFVSYHADKLIIDVFPTGLDDTENIQCALDAATEFKASAVLLAKADYYISSIYSGNFKGSFEGVAQGLSNLYVSDQSIDCAAMVAEGRTPAAIKFDSGEPSLRFMTIAANSPCISGEPIENLIHFTGRSTLESCAADNVFGLVDRVEILGPGRGAGVNVAVAVSSESEVLGGCAGLLGTFKLNRSTVSGTTIGVLTAMRSAAEVDINFNDFSQNSFAVLVANSNQSTTVRSNTFNIEEASSETEYAAAISLISNDEAAPRETRLVVYKNKFNLSGEAGFPIDGLSIFNDEAQNVSLSVTNNVFNISGQNIVGLWIEDVNNAAVATNTFNGFGLSGISVINFNSTTISGWVITANKNFDSFDSDFVDIEFDIGVTEAFVGPRQNATISDSGSGNIILSASPVPTGLAAQTSDANKDSKNITDRKVRISERHQKFFKFYK